MHGAGVSAFFRICVCLFVCLFVCLYVQKSVLFRGGTDVKSDERSALIYRMLTMPVMGSKPFIYPTLLALHRLGGDEGTSDPTSVNSNLVGPDSIILPPSLPLTVDSLVSDGMFLLFDGVETFIWLGRAAPPSFLEAMFGCSSFEGVDVSYVALLSVCCLLLSFCSLFLVSVASFERFPCCAPMLSSTHLTPS
jgi:hypothetical protein